jgi:UDP-N-acetylglucosamine 2-epimerase (non-hydrolysing)
MVVGDVNSTIACTLVASKVTFPGSSRRARPLIAHVEAGLRSFDRSMPEEINRILTDALSDVLFITEKSAATNLTREGVANKKIHFVGNTMVDTLLKHRERAKQSGIISRLGLWEDSGRAKVRPYAVVTLHRPSNVDDADTLKRILDAISVVAKDVPVFWPVHPRTLKRIEDFRLGDYMNPHHISSGPIATSSRIHTLEPLGYLDFLCLMSTARLLLTDSGGIQEEATVLGVPCVTLRENTERPVTITQGTNVLSGTERDAIISYASRQLRRPRKVKRPRFWDGRAGERVIKALVREMSGKT